MRGCFNRGFLGQVLPGARLDGPSGYFRAPGALRPEPNQPLALQVEAAQCEAHAEPVMVLPDASIAHPVEVEDTLQDSERVLDLNLHPRLRRVLALRGFIQIVLEPGPAAGRILRAASWGLVPALRAQPQVATWLILSRNSSRHGLRPFPKTRLCRLTLLPHRSSPHLLLYSSERGVEVAQSFLGPHKPLRVHDQEAGRGAASLSVAVLAD